MKLILGSSSVFRQKVLRERGINFDIIEPNIDEKKVRTLHNEDTPIVLSYAKSQAVIKKITEPAIIITCDQVIVCNGEILEKPEHIDEIRRWYTMYAQHPVHYINGITVYNTENQASLTAQEISIANFKEIPDSFINEQFSKGDILKCCGAISDETHDTYGTLIQGSKESVIGIPVDFIMDMIKKIE
ncbi:MAG: Maf family protein [Candidatus Pacebacteria bacterium]|nr:Maf family protein [Candidatus Paceibacterota bacterium]